MSIWSLGRGTTCEGLGLVEDVCYWVRTQVSKTQVKTQSLSRLPVDQDVKLSAISPAPCLPVYLNHFHEWPKPLKL